MNGFGLFIWRDGRTYRGEYKDDKKQNFGIYYGNDGKKYEGFWEFGTQKNLGKYTKKDGSYKIGLWDENKLITAITNENEIGLKLSKIDLLVEDTLAKVTNVLNNLKNLFGTYLPNLQFESFLEFN